MTDRPISAAIFDMDGVVTDTARAHASAWKTTFDAYLKKVAKRTQSAFMPFDAEQDYRAFVDGKPRLDGVADFLNSRGMTLVTGNSDDPPETETLFGIGNAKNMHFQAWLNENKVESFPSTLGLIKVLRSNGIKTGVFTSSRNGRAVLGSAGVLDLFNVKVDGNEMARLGLPGKPDPAIMLETAKRLDVRPVETAILEDSRAGVEAGAGGGFALVIGVNYSGDGEALAEHGADIVVDDLMKLVFNPVRRTLSIEDCQLNPGV